MSEGNLGSNPGSKLELGSASGSAHAFSSELENAPLENAPLENAPLPISATENDYNAAAEQAEQAALEVAAEQAAKKEAAEQAAAEQAKAAAEAAAEARDPCGYFIEKVRFFLDQQKDYNFFKSVDKALNSLEQRCKNQDIGFHYYTQENSQLFDFYHLFFSKYDELPTKFILDKENLQKNMQLFCAITKQLFENEFWTAPFWYNLTHLGWITNYKNGKTYKTQGQVPWNVNKNIIRELLFAQLMRNRFIRLRTPQTTGGNNLKNKRLSKRRKSIRRRRSIRRCQSIKRRQSIKRCQSIRPRQSIRRRQSIKRCQCTKRRRL